MKNQFWVISQTIKYIYDRNIFHNDIKPENIFYSKEGQPKIGDFGCARIIHEKESNFKIREEWIKRNLLYAGPEIFDFIENE